MTLAEVAAASGPSPVRFSNVPDVGRALERSGYLSSADIDRIVFLAEHLAKPILVEGPAGTGKTELAKSMARLLDAELVRLQCYEGLDESKALYEWDYKKQLLRIQAGEPVGPDAGAPDATWRNLEKDIFSEDFLLTRPLLKAISAPEPVVLLIDEVDRVPIETEALFLELLSEYQVSIPELGTVRARRVPMVFLTSNSTRDLSDALKRRCLYLHLGYPDRDREVEIVRRKVPDISEDLCQSLVTRVQQLRALSLRKEPSISETLDWAAALAALGVTVLDQAVMASTLPVLLKYHSDVETAVRWISDSSGSAPKAVTSRKRG